MWQEGSTDDKANCFNMVPAPSNALPAMVAEATTAATVALLFDAASTVMATGYATDWRPGDAKDSAAIVNAADWRPGDVKDSMAITMQ